MSSLTRIASAAGAALLAAAAAEAHNHMTVDTATGTPGEPLIIAVGYLGGEASYTIDQDGQLLHDGAPEVYLLPNLLGAPAGFEGWWGGDGLTLTSDYNAGSGRLDGGDFAYEIVSIEVAGGGSPAADFAWGQSEGGTIGFSARHSAASRIDRSFHVGFGGHPHGQVYAVSETGLYDIGLVAWDANGVYADSQPVYIRVLARLCVEDLDGDGLIDLTDLSTLLLHFGETGDAEPQDGDLNGDGTVDLKDLSGLLAAFGGSCS